jgi:hypothetical protein
MTSRLRRTVDDGGRRDQRLRRRAPRKTTAFRRVCSCTVEKSEGMSIKMMN